MYVHYESASFPYFALLLYHRLGDTVMEEAVVRLVAREAMAALERERDEEAAAAGVSEEEVPPSLTGSALSWRLDSAIRVVVSNANLGAVSIHPRLTGRGGMEASKRGRFLHFFFASDTSVALDLRGTDQWGGTCVEAMHILKVIEWERVHRGHTDRTRSEYIQRAFKPGHVHGNMATSTAETCTEAPWKTYEDDADSRDDLCDLYCHMICPTCAVFHDPPLVFGRRR